MASPHNTEWDFNPETFFDWEAPMTQEELDALWLSEESLTEILGDSKPEEPIPNSDLGPSLGLEEPMAQVSTGVLHNLVDTVNRLQEQVAQSEKYELCPSMGFATDISQNHWPTPKVGFGNGELV
ncbi:hypothetical protein H2204_011722 [Knufia peltigerae]|uniref:Uncharacterized protein n=1 Tax=Knufia peltigerae TaxID=1002370 RepID=A0AA38XTL0_9EURO|nr:hypothetical protein H2204_011722 [Knufia peltigerae]